MPNSMFEETQRRVSTMTPLVKVPAVTGIIHRFSPTTLPPIPRKAIGTSSVGTPKTMTEAANQDQRRQETAVAQAKTENPTQVAQQVASGPNIGPAPSPGSKMATAPTKNQLNPGMARTQTPPYSATNSIPTQSNKPPVAREVKVPPTTGVASMNTGQANVPGVMPSAGKFAACSMKKKKKTKKQEKALKRAEVLSILIKHGLAKQATTLMTHARMAHFLRDFFTKEGMLRFIKKADDKGKALETVGKLHAGFLKAALALDLGEEDLSAIGTGAGIGGAVGTGLGAATALRGMSKERKWAPEIESLRKAPNLRSLDKKVLRLAPVQKEYQKQFPLGSMKNLREVIRRNGWSKTIKTTAKWGLGLGALSALLGAGIGAATRME